MRHYTCVSGCIEPKTERILLARNRYDYCGIAIRYPACIIMNNDNSNSNNTLQPSIVTFYWLWVLGKKEKKDGVVCPRTIDRALSEHVPITSAGAHDAPFLPSAVAITFECSSFMENFTSYLEKNSRVYCLPSYLTALHPSNHVVKSLRVTQCIIFCILIIDRLWRVVQTKIPCVDVPRGVVVMRTYYYISTVIVCNMYKYTFFFFTYPMLN